MENIHTILIANRGEIASRIIRTCRKMGIRSVAVYSDADRSAPFVRQADTAVFIGESAPSASYLDQEKIIAAAKSSGANAIHPGYGFLSENAGFARKCAENNIIFIGPNPTAIEEMGSKSRAKAIMQSNGVPTVPGYQGKDQSEETLVKAALQVGFPLLLKATAGGGGKGMRIVHRKEDLVAGIQAAKRESLSAFGDDELIIEKYVASGRHIEFQIFGDKHGNAIHLLERECTIQRRYQKVLEESPSPVMSPELRLKMGDAAVKAAKALAYDNAGTVEFIYDEHSGEFYFLEVNTRLQVEHPVTEEITGIDLVEWQVEMAQGGTLPLKQEEVRSDGYAMELRLYAEDAANDFTPVTGTLQRIEWPQVSGLRIETAVESGSEITVFYDPMIAKIIIWDATRNGAFRKMSYVLDHLVSLGMVTNQPFLSALIKHPDVRQGKYDTHFISNNLQVVGKPSLNDEQQFLFATAATLYNWKLREGKRKIASSIPSGWRNNFFDYQQDNWLIDEFKINLKYRFYKGSFRCLTENVDAEVRLLSFENGRLQIELNNTLHTFHIASSNSTLHLQHELFGTFSLTQQARFPEKEVQKVAGGYEAPMPSTIVKVLVEIGQAVKAGDALLIISSMKMENTITADEDGIVNEIYVEAGQNVEAGYLLLTLKTEEA